MDTKDAEKLEQQRQRRKRINQMKTTIIVVIAVWMVVSFLAVVVLGAWMVKLNSRLNVLEGQKTTMVSPSEDSEQVGLSEKESVTGSVAESEAAEAMEAPYEDVVTGIDTADNRASEGDEHRVYLTFDCNPGANTEKILDVLKAHNVKATFFVTGSESEEAKPVYRRIVEEGHTIGMNSYANQYSTIYSSAEAFEQDYVLISDYIYELTGVKSTFYRFPGGSSNKISNVSMAEFVHVLNENQITYFDWNISAGDTANDYTVDDILSNVTAGVSQYKTSVVLLHDDENKSTTAEAIGPLIEALQKQQANILPIDENTYVVQYIKADSVG